MKTFLKLKSVTILCLSFMFISCDLDLQESFNFEPEVDLTDPHANKTAWEFIQTRTALNEDGSFNGEELNYMIAAIKKAGFEDLYNQAVDTSRTYLLLNNNAFTGRGDVINIVTGSSTVPDGETPEQTMERVDTPEKLEKLRTVLRYHIVDAYVAQVPTLAVAEVRYIFQTLIPGDDGLIAFNRNSRWSIQINRAPAPLPTSATSQNENVRAHNYVFNNGIGHFIADPVRNRPY
ncbi:hypothetical protein [Cellulophaga tyrosinoxydans]|uniref:Fasciclin domain-containing protein n=1 Tax=Cellulophaga tyrosinoxydans TaxID=504486 RepID=A0A1W2C3L5_9FLAO|nr:hypothetical protein [Cellulophaga tyrosinoxydans]SMC79614.1 hypothetical protein SAMN05660703_2788 [Cellulophaga tyrosinoxydans]